MYKYIKVIMFCTYPNGDYCAVLKVRDKTVLKRVSKYWSKTAILSFWLNDFTITTAARKSLFRIE